MSTFNPLAMAIKPLIEKAIQEDSIFAEELLQKTEEGIKSVEQCADYLMGEAYEYASNHKDGNYGLAAVSDEELIGMIKHYYDEDGIEIKKVGAGAKAKVVKTTAKTEQEGEDGDEEQESAPIETAPKPKTPTKAELKRGADCGDLFADMFS